ncbi:MAG: hypothetical protein LUQ26_09935 [Methylococcaceae bacterium]|nr:hypothetical protein [Methylococcaceae bacterium]
MNPEIFKKLLTEAFIQGVDMERMYAPTGGVPFDGNYTTDPAEMAEAWFRVYSATLAKNLVDVCVVIS